MEYGVEGNGPVQFQVGSRKPEQGQTSQGLIGKLGSTYQLQIQVDPQRPKLLATENQADAALNRISHFTSRMEFGFRPAFWIEVPVGTTLTIRRLNVRPNQLQSIFNGKDLAGWKIHPERKSVFSVTERGELHVQNGPGDLQSEGQWADFVLQLESRTNGQHLNSGIFFRCLPGQYQQGYEAQIRNQWKENDRSQPVDFGTGAIYRRQPARRVVADDLEWFTLTIVADGNHLATWVNGYQVSDWSDPRPPHANARQGCKLDPGPISIQGHDPTTDLYFRNLRIAELAPLPRSTR
jgi:hypothetical protein